VTTAGWLTDGRGKSFLGRGMSGHSDRLGQSRSNASCSRTAAEVFTEKLCCRWSRRYRILVSASTLAFCIWKSRRLDSLQSRTLPSHGQKPKPDPILARAMWRHFIRALSDQDNTVWRVLLFEGIIKSVLHKARYKSFFAIFCVFSAQKESVCMTAMIFLPASCQLQVQ
jgi:hypothetical protein